jgi:hypothetical protein
MAQTACGGEGRCLKDAFAAVRSYRRGGRFVRTAWYVPVMAKKSDILWELSILAAEYYNYTFNIRRKTL